MKNSNRWIVILIFIIFGCEGKVTKYEFSVYRNGNIEFLREPINENSERLIENGDFIIDDSNGDTLMSGKFKNGFKDGSWKYFPNDSQIVNVNWAIYKNENQEMSINYPSNWNLIKSSKRPFQAVFSTKSEVKEDKYFIVSTHLEDSIDMGLYEYWKLYNNNTHSNDSVISYLLRKFSQDSLEFYFSTYTINRNNEEIFIMNFLGESDNMIYDITYSSLKDDVDMKFIVFLDMIRSIRFRDKRFFSPFNKKTQIIDLQRPVKPARRS